MSKKTWVALFRGINVGGRNRAPMARLTSVFESLGCRSIRTYIQSGNVVFDVGRRGKKALTSSIEDAVESEFGFSVAVLLLTADELLTAIELNPFRDSTADQKMTHFYFLSGSPEIKTLESISEIATESEKFALEGSVFYLHAPDGFGTSKLAKSAESKLGVKATARNLKTVLKLESMVLETK
ncbi:MAG: DUF1697 domain-containing protein [Planctomycetota bacterium]